MQRDTEATIRHAIAQGSTVIPSTMVADLLADRPDDHVRQVIAEAAGVEVHDLPREDILRWLLEQAAEDPHVESLPVVTLAEFISYTRLRQSWQAEHNRTGPADQAYTRLVDLLDLDDMAGGQPATWDDVVTYTAKRIDACDMALRTIERRNTVLAAAFGLTGDYPWPKLAERVAKRDGCHGREIQLRDAAVRLLNRLDEVDAMVTDDTVERARTQLREVIAVNARAHR